MKKRTEKDRYVQLVPKEQLSRDRYDSCEALQDLSKKGQLRLQYLLSRRIR